MLLLIAAWEPSSHVDIKSVILSDNLGRKWLATYLQSNKMQIARINISEDAQPSIEHSEIDIHKNKISDKQPKISWKKWEVVEDKIDDAISQICS